MARFMHSVDFFTFRRSCQMQLALFWLSGLGAGALVFRYAGEPIVSMMPLAAACQPSIVSLLLGSSLPFLFCGAAAFFQRPRVIPVVCLFRAFLYGYTLCAVFSSFSGCGWLIRFLLLFTATFGACLLYGYAGRYVSGLRPFSVGGLLGCELVLAVLALVDFTYVSPLLRQLLS